MFVVVRPALKIFALIGISQFVLLVVHQTLAAQSAADPIPAACAPFVSAFDAEIYRAPTAFDRKRQKGWYFRWWSGHCERVPFPDRWTCTADQDKAWSKIVSHMSDEAQGDAQILSEICKLGELIGLEWAKDNIVRCVHTSQLEKLWPLLDDSSKTPLTRVVATRAAIERYFSTCRSKS